MAQVFTINESRTLLTTLVHEVWQAEGENTKSYFEDWINVKKLSTPVHIDYRMAGFSKWVERAEKEDITYDDLTFGEAITTEPKNWGTGFSVSEEVIEDLADAGPNEGINRAKLGGYADFVSRSRRTAIWTVDVECTDLLLNGTATSTEYVLRDSVAWFGTHTTLKNPTVSQSNLNTHASLSAETLKTMTTALNLQLDDRGDYISRAGSNVLVVSESDAFRAYEILNTAGQVDTANNNINALKKNKYKVVENPYLNVNAASYAGYFLLREGAHSAEWFWRKKPEFAKQPDFDSVAMKFRGRFRGVRRVKDWRGAVGDNGS